MVFTLGSFVLVTVAVAFVSWLKTKGTDETSKDGYFLGGRSLSGLVIFGSLMMTNLSAEQLVGRNGQGYAAGMTAMGWETMCPIALTLMALFFIPKYFKLGISTIPEFLESRFDRATRVIVSFIFLVAYIVTMLPLGAVRRLGSDGAYLRYYRTDGRQPFHGNHRNVRRTRHNRRYLCNLRRPEGRCGIRLLVNGVGLYHRRGHPDPGSGICRRWATAASLAGIQDFIATCSRRSS